MRITHINVTDTKGGAARAAHRLHTGLRRLGYQSQMLVAERSSGEPDVRAFSTSPLDPVLRRLRYETGALIGFVKPYMERYINPPRKPGPPADDGGSADDVRALMRIVRDRVAATTGYVLRSEIRLVGFDEGED